MRNGPSDHHNKSKYRIILVLKQTLFSIFPTFFFSSFLDFRVCSANFSSSFRKPVFALLFQNKTTFRFCLSNIFVWHLHVVSALRHIQSTTYIINFLSLFFVCRLFDLQHGSSHCFHAPLLFSCFIIIFFKPILLNCTI